MPTQITQAKSSFKERPEPGYKQTEVGVIPADWTIETLGELGKWLSGGTPSMSEKTYWDGSIPWVSPKDMKVARLHDASDHISEKALTNGTRLAPQHALLIVVRGMILAHSLPVARAERSLAFNQDIKALIARDSVDSDFLLWWFQANRSALLSLTAESTHGTKRLPSEALFAQKIALPPFSEQKAIAEVLNKADAITECFERLVAKKRLLKRGVMRELLTGRLRLRGFTDATTGYKQTEVGEIPEDWEVKAFGNLFDFNGGLSASRDQLSSEGYCYLHYGDIHKSSKSFIDVGAEYQDIPKLDVPLKRVSPGLLLNDGDVVFVDASEDDEGTSKHVVIINKENIPYISGLHTIVAKSKSAALDHTYRRYCFQTANIKRQFRYFAVGTKVSGISKTNIAKVVLPVPPLAEQEAIAAILSAMDAEIVLLEAQLAKYHQIKQGLMQRLLTGRIRLV
jgi:type I restriction enzyme S subunit